MVSYSFSVLRQCKAMPNKRVKSITFARIVFLLLFVCAVSTQAQTPQFALSQQKAHSRGDWRTSPFRYLIFENVVQNDDSGGSASRDVAILMEEKAFSVENLKKLYHLVSRRFPNPQLLNIWIETSLVQVPTPEEKDEGASSERPRDPQRAAHPRALVIRSKVQTLVRNTPSPPYINMETIVLEDSR